MAKGKKESKLQQTKGEFKISGIVTGLEKDNAYGTGETKSGAPYKKINFGIKTSKENQIRVGLFAMLQEDIYLWNNDKKSSVKKKYRDWAKNGKAWEESGNTLIGISLKIGDDEETVRLPQYDAVDYINNNLSNGDSVTVVGDISYSTSVGQDGKTNTYINYNINGIYNSTKAIDFESEDFKEVNNFKQEFMFVGAEKDEDTNKLYVTGRIINYNETYVDTQFVINADKSKTLEKLAKAYENSMSFGTTIYAHGDIHNRAITSEVESDSDFEEDDDDFLSAMMGEEDAMETVVTYINELEIKGTAKSTKKITNIVKDRYTAEDFTDENDSHFVEDSEDDDFAGEDDDFDDMEEFDSDELPFEL